MRTLMSGNFVIAYNTQKKKKKNNNKKPTL